MHVLSTVSTGPWKVVDRGARGAERESEGRERSKPVATLGTSYSSDEEGYSAKLIRLASMKRSRSAPAGDRAYMPGYDMMFRKDKRLLSWTWAIDHFSKTHNYFLSTTREDGKPHVMPVWGVWLDRAFYFSTGRRSRKSKNLSLNPHCVVCPENASKAVILEGTAKEIRKGSLRTRFVAAYKKKYDWDMSDTSDPIYEVRPWVIFGITENADANPTRWRFSN